MRGMSPAFFVGCEARCWGEQLTAFWRTSSGKARPPPSYISERLSLATYCLHYARTVGHILAADPTPSDASGRESRSLHRSARGPSARQGAKLSGVSLKIYLFMCRLLTICAHPAVSPTARRSWRGCSAREPHRHTRPTHPRAHPPRAAFAFTDTDPLLPQALTSRAMSPASHGAPSVLTSRA